MSSVYAARLRNAYRIGNKLIKLLEDGYTVFDEEGHKVETVDFKGFSGNAGLRINSCIIYFDADTELDNGMQTTIKDFNDKFKDWKAFKPSDAITIF